MPVKPGNHKVPTRISPGCCRWAHPPPPPLCPPQILPIQQISSEFHLPIFPDELGSIHGGQSGGSGFEGVTSSKLPPPPPLCPPQILPSLNYFLVYVLETPVSRSSRTHFTVPRPKVSPSFQSPWSPCGVRDAKVNGVSQSQSYPLAEETDLRTSFRTSSPTQQTYPSFRLTTR